MAAEPLSVLLRLGDRAVLRHASRLLAVFGYDVHCYASSESARVALLAGQVDIVISDTTDGLDEALTLIRATGGDRQSRYVYSLLLTGELSPADVAQALEAGVDDFLAMPLEHGELLARLRTAARVIEFERRWQFRDQLCAVQGPLNRRGFVNQLQAVLDDSQQNRQLISCIAIELDQSAVWGRLASQPAVRAVLTQIVDKLKTATATEHAFAKLSDQQFAVVVRGGPQAGASLVTSLREAIASASFRIDESLPAITLSCGIVTTTATDDSAYIIDAAGTSLSAAQLLDQAQQCAAQARQSGGDCTIIAGELAAEDQHWFDLGTKGTLFEHTLARDIMVPSTVTLERKDSIATAAQLFEHTQLRALPVIDDDGKLIGLMSASGVTWQLESSDCAAQPVASIMATDVVSFDEQTTLAALIDYFTQESPLVIVIVNKGRPTGLVTPSSLATLSEQISAATFAVDETDSIGRLTMIVPNLCGVDVEG